MRLILIFILLSFVLLSEKSFAQGTIPNISIEVRRSLSGKIKTFGFPQVVTIGDEVPIVVEFENIGSIEMDSKIEIRVFNVSDVINPLARYIDVLKHLLPGQINRYSVVYLPPAVGTYAIEVRVTYDGKLATDFGYLWVLPPSPPIKIIQVPYPIPYPVTMPPPSVVEIFNISVTYQKNYTLKEGTYIIPIFIENTGNMPLTNIKLSVISDLDLDVYPKFIFSLNPRDKATFLMSVIIPKGATGERKIFFELTSNEVRRTGEIIITIYPELTLEMLKNLIENYEFLISRLGYEIETAKARGIDVSKAEEFLRRARESLNLAKYFFGKEMIEEVEKSIDLTGEFIKRATIELSIASIPKIPILPFYINLLLNILIIVAIILISILIYKKKRKKIEARRE